MKGRRQAFLGAVTMVAWAAGCSAGGGTYGFQPLDTNAGGTYGGPPSSADEHVDNDAGQLVGSRPADAATPIEDSGVPVVDSGTQADAGPGVDSSPPIGNACPTPLGAGDLAIVELMIASQDAAGDQGQWIEVQSTRDCTLDLFGLHAAASWAAPVYTMDVTTHVSLPPYGVFVIANSLDPVLNNELPTTPLLFGWAGSPADVLSSTGGNVTLSNSASSTVVYDLDYPEFLLILTGTTISFPQDCAWSDLPNWDRWSFSNNFWFSTFQGTPNAENTDVTCY